MLTSLRLENFKNFESASVPIGSFTVLVGTNASGKTNIRDAFRFLHGVSRGYTLAEIIGEKWIEGGVLQWKGIRGGVRETAFSRRNRFALEVTFLVIDKKEDDGVPATSKDVRHATYRIEVEINAKTTIPHVVAERLVIEGRGQFVFDSNPAGDSLEQDDPLYLGVRLRKAYRAGFVGRTVKFQRSRPVLTQILEHPDVHPELVREHARLAIGALASMRFLDLHPDAMRIPSLPGQTVLGDRGENLSSVLQAICEDPAKKKALVHWVRELTPLDATDFEFIPDQTGRILVNLVEEQGHKTSAYSASDGTLRFLAMIAALLGPEAAGFYFYEELENGIHPTRLHLLLQLIEKKTAAWFPQLVATSHSPQLLSQLSKESLENAVLVYRLPGSRSADTRRVLDIPEASRVLAKQDLARLYSSGWLEDAVSFSMSLGPETSEE